jgi:hypothetical protein
LPIPLQEGNADAILELGSALAAIYDEAGYDLSINYTAVPPPPVLSEADAEWVRAMAGQKTNLSLEQ